MTKKLNIALVTDVLPDKAYTAGQVLEKIIDCTPQAQFDLYWVNQSNLPDSASLPANTVLMETISFSASGSAGNAQHVRPAFFVPLVRQLVGMLFAHYDHVLAVRHLRYAGSLTKKLTKSVLVGRRLRKTIKMRNYDAVWLVLQGERLAIAYAALSFGLNQKIILQQWDPISWWLGHRQYGKKITTVIERITRMLEHRAHINLVPSFAWEKKMKDKGLRTIRIDNFFSGASLNEQPFIKLESDCLRAVFIGQPYASNELKQMLQGLKVEAANLGRDIVLHYFGNSSLRSEELGVQIVSHPYQDRDLLVERIRKFDLALLPYPTEALFDEASRLSFPSKSKLYLAAGLPILAWCQPDSSPQLFYKMHYGDYYFNMLESEGLAAYVKKIVEATPSAIKERLMRANRILNDYFSETAELGPFHNMLNGIEK